MPKVASFEPFKTKRAGKRWRINVPAELSDTGKRKRIYFDSKEKASGMAELLKAKLANVGVKLATMPAAQLNEAAEAFSLLDAYPGVRLLDCVRAHLAHLVARSKSLPFGKMFEAFIDAKAGRSPKYLRELRITKQRFAALHDKLASDVTHDELRGLIEPMPPGARNAAMRYLRAVFFYGIKRGYLTENPVSRLDFAATRRREVETVPARKVQALLNDALANELELLPFFTLGFFAGVRPDGELLKLEWRDIDLAEKMITIRPEVSKTNRRRFVELSDNAVLWLNAYRERGGSATGLMVKLSPALLRKKRTACLGVGRAEVHKWIQQGMRHTFCSNWLATHQDVNKLVLMSGHDSVETMWRHYHRGTTKAEAAKFWVIVPKSTGGKILPFAKAS